MLGVIGTLCFLMVVLCCLIIAVMVVFDLAVGTWRMFFVRLMVGVVSCSAKSKKNADTKSNHIPFR